MSKCMETAKKLRAELVPNASIIDVGCGDKAYSTFFECSGFNVTTMDISPHHEPDICSDLQGHQALDKFDAVWCAHTLEHIQNVNQAILNLKSLCKDGGVLAITVPPLKHNIVGGHVTLWNEGLLLYNLILCGIDCRMAKVGSYGYNISVIVRNEIAMLPDLNHDDGDIEKLAKYFPYQIQDNIKQGFDGRLGSINW